MRLTAPLKAMAAAAITAGRSLMRHWGAGGISFSRKGRGDFVSDADLAAERHIAKILHAAYPEYGFLMEESGLTPGPDVARRWIVDPLDGTTNFLHGVPYFAVSIALQEGDKTIAGLVLIHCAGKCLRPHGVGVPS